MPLPAKSRAVAPSMLGAADADRPRAVAGGVDPADGAGVAAAVEALVLGDAAPAAASRGRPHDRRGRVQGGDQLEHRRRRRATAGPRPAWRGAARWRRRRPTARPRSRGTSTSGSSVSWTMSMVIWCSWRSLADASSAGGQAGVGGRVAAAGRGAGHRVGAHDVAGAGHEQLGAGADEAVDVGRRSSRGTAGAAGRARPARSNGASASTTTSRASTTLLEAAAGARWPRWPRRRASHHAVGRARRARPRTPPGAAAARATARRRRRRVGVAGADRRDPAGAVVGPAHTTAGTTQLGVGPRRRGRAGRRRRPARSRAGRPRRRRRWRPARRRPRRRGTAQRDARGRPARPAPLEQHAVGARRRPSRSTSPSSRRVRATSAGHASRRPGAGEQLGDAGATAGRRSTSAKPALGEHRRASRRAAGR